MTISKYKDFITNVIGLDSNLTWQYAISESYDDNCLLNNIAFSFISKEEKIKLFELYSDNKITKSLKIDLSYFFDEHFDDIHNKYPITEELIEIFVEKFLEWITIIDKEVKEENIDNILKKVKTNNFTFWFFLIKALTRYKLFKSILNLINEKKDIFKKQYLYEDLIIYEILCMREANYLNRKSDIDKLCKLSKKIPSYKTTQLTLMMECAIIKNNLSKFRQLIENNLDYIQKLSIIHLLNIYELSIFSELVYLQNIIERLLKNNDISSYNGMEEYNIYKLLNALKSNDEYELLAMCHLLKNYDFRHIKWYLNKKNEKRLIGYMNTIINKNNN